MENPKAKKIFETDNLEELEKWNMDENTPSKEINFSAS